MSIDKLNSLKAYKKCKSLRTKLSEIIKTKIPKTEKYRLQDQMIRTSRSVTANIAEGYGRFHFQENIQFVRIARGSLHELLDHYSVALEEKYIVEDTYQDLNSETEVCIKIINGYINYLKEQKLNRQK